MDKAKAGEMVQYLGRIFPRWKVTAELAVLWGDAFVNFPEQAVRSAINQHRAERSAEDPDLRMIREKLRLWSEENPGRPMLGRGEGRTAEERVERYMVGGKSAWIADGMPEEHWSKMEEAIKLYEKTGGASHWSVAASIVGEDWAKPDRPKTVARWRRLKELADKARIAEGKA